MLKGEGLRKAIIFGAIAIGGFYLGMNFGNRTIEVPLPKPMGLPLDTENLSGFACETLLSAEISGLQPVEWRKSILKGNLSSQGQTVAVRIEGESLKLTSTNALSWGRTEPATYKILVNNADMLAAVYTYGGPLGATIESFILDKKNAIATWDGSSLGPHAISSSLGDGGISYLSCVASL